ncbi:hypothetical protein HPP92_005197 [Vanilla planifolia]|uniref:BZIP domain-containing protein n=2 Tax=Vanilla planifolia TaxID=51239 RepID=A0A835V8V0_VANPL|nr:hypothetical protein HPP92_005197 [Vanilla planifolia]
MAQLPPKNPCIPSCFQKNPAITSFFPAAAHPPWLDEFLDFSAARRGAHRRSVSDSISFLDPPEPNVDFDRIDDDQLLSMFSDHAGEPGPEVEAPASLENPATPSDHNSVNEENSTEQKAQNACEEVQSECEAAPAAPPALMASTSHPSPLAPPEQIADPKRVKRILANRQSAQRSRVRKLQYISELERSVTTLQTEVSALSPRVAFLDHQRSILTVGNSHLKQRIAALAQDKIFKDAHQEALKKEIERLRQVYHQQSLKKMAAALPENGNKIEPLS